MATAFKKPNLSQSVESEVLTPDIENVTSPEDASPLDALWSDEGSEEVAADPNEEAELESDDIDPNDILNEKFDSDSDAIANLDRFNIVYDGGIIQLVKGIEYPAQVLNAADYLCNEWDYGANWVEADAASVGENEPAIEATEARQIEITAPVRTALDDLLDQISNAHLACTEAAAEVFHAENAVKSAKAEQKVAEERYKARVEVLMELTSKITHDSDRPLFPLTKPVAPASPMPTAAFTSGSATEATDVATDSGQVVSDPVSDPAGEEALPDWQTIKLAALEQHGVSAAVIEKLAESQINTLGELESLRAEISNGKAKWPKGIGEKKITAIENAVVAFLAAHQYSDSTSVPVTQVDESGEASNEAGEEVATTMESPEEETETDASSEPTPEEWESMSHRQQLAWLNARAVYLETTAEEDDELEAIDVLDYRNTDSEIQWQEGVDSYNEDDLASNCPYGPGEDCDAWLQGWLWAGKQDTLDTNLPAKE